MTTPLAINTAAKRNLTGPRGSGPEIAAMKPRAQTPVRRPCRLEDGRLAARILGPVSASDTRPVSRSGSRGGVDFIEVMRMQKKAVEIERYRHVRAGDPPPPPPWEPMYALMSDPVIIVYHIPADHPVDIRTPTFDLPRDIEDPKRPPRIPRALIRYLRDQLAHQALDANGDGIVTADEAGSLFDLDGDGIVTFQEWQLVRDLLRALEEQHRPLKDLLQEAAGAPRPELPRIERTIAAALVEGDDSALQAAVSAWVTAGANGPAESAESLSAAEAAGALFAWGNEGAHDKVEKILAGEILPWRLGADFLPMDLEALREALTHADPKVRARAARAVEAAADNPHVRKAEIDALCDALIDPAPKVRAAAASALSRFAHLLSAQDLQALRKAAKDPDPNVRRKAVQALGGAASRRSFGRADRQALRDACKDPDWRVRFAALRALAKKADAGDLKALRTGLRDPNPYVRQAAADSLGQAAKSSPHFGDEDDNALRAALKDPDPEVRVRALRALMAAAKHMKLSPEQLEARFGDLIRAGLLSGDRSARSAAADAARRLPQAAQVRLARSILKDRSLTTEQRREALQALLWEMTSGAFKELLCGADSDTMRALADAIGRYDPLWNKCEHLPPATKDALIAEIMDLDLPDEEIASAVFSVLDEGSKGADRYTLLKDLMKTARGRRILQDRARKDPDFVGRALSDISSGGTVPGAPKDPADAAEWLLEHIAKDPAALDKTLRTMRQAGGPAAIAKIIRALAARGVSSPVLQKLLAGLGGKSRSGKTYLALVLADPAAKRDFTDAISRILDRRIGPNPGDWQRHFEDVMRDLAKATGGDPVAKKTLRAILERELGTDWSDGRKKKTLQRLGMAWDAEATRTTETIKRVKAVRETVVEFGKKIKQARELWKQGRHTEAQELVKRAYTELQAGMKYSTETGGGVNAEVISATAKTKIEAEFKMKVGGEVSKSTRKEVERSYGDKSLDEVMQETHERLRTTVEREEKRAQSSGITRREATDGERHFEVVQDVLGDIIDNRL